MAQTPTMPRALRRILRLEDFEPAARAYLPRPIFGYVAGAAEDNASLRMNRASFDDYSFVHRVMVNVSQRSQAVELFGRSYASPFGIAPMGMAALYAYRGDLVMAAAARDANVPMILSGSSLIPMEEVVKEAPDTWFQAYLPGETAPAMALIDRAGRAGFRTLVITVDVSVMANRENNIRSGFSAPLRPSLRLAWDGVTHPSWLLGTFTRTLLRHGMPHFENNFAGRGAPILSSNVLRDYNDRGHITWKHLEAIRRVWPGPMVLKGILRPQDAVTAREIGADAIVVSNHGGRQLDGCAAPLRVLPGIVAAVPDLPVLLDSGVRRGTDVLKAIGLGARMVLVGRPFAYAATIAGQAGVAHGIKLLSDEVFRNMGMLGIANLADMTPDFLRREYPGAA
ncbi:alpha-hydroxy acid oxidase [Noviherbaspirillum pedocola]|uniref:Alpha-hydroxy-acid oxidizing protein n=1 Tax=Noviherbaspirillum pedocola TaxID=2801341 RepID=A0A934SYC5_9BURK|nr:alpha-hydroxy acid oxidase [Noviherbaspirillum pedocola]MBK4735137.1 alpha-hydroxy-acid oxidizing protein [Noviherbaspirillum pedocola]